MRDASSSPTLSLSLAQRNEERAQEVEVGGAATQPPDMQADYLRKTMRKCKAFEKLSEMEMDELALRGEQTSKLGF